MTTQQPEEIGNITCPPNKESLFVWAPTVMSRIINLFFHSEEGLDNIEILDIQTGMFSQLYTPVPVTIFNQSVPFDLPTLQPNERFTIRFKSRKHIPVNIQVRIRRRTA